MKEIYMSSLYRHYKGKLYYVIGEAREVTDGKYEEKVVYHALYGEKELFVRDREDFLMDVLDHKENTTGQKRRFELYQEIDF